MVGRTPARAVSPCWRTVMSTGHSSPALRPLGGNELRPTVAQPPAPAAGTATAASARTSKSFFIDSSVLVGLRFEVGRGDRDRPEGVDLGAVRDEAVEDGEGPAARAREDDAEGVGADARGR